MTALLLVQSILLVLLTPQTPAAQRARPATFFTTPMTVQEMTGKQAVVNTTAGAFVFDLDPQAAPNHVGYFIKLAREGAYNGTTFHRVMLRGLIQGGDPLSKDPTQSNLYGTGGLGRLKSEVNAGRTTRGAVAAVLQPGKPDSAGSQFFVCVSDQPTLDGKYTVFGRVAEGMDVVQKISEAPASAEGRPTERIVINEVTIRDKPPPEPEPFADASAADMAKYRAVLDTSVGPITLEFFPDRAPEHVRNFLRLAQAGVFDGTSFHRVVRGFVVQTGALSSRGPLTEKQQKAVRTLQPEFNDTKHVKGIVSMAHGDDPASASTSFFIVIGDAPSLNGKYTAFGRVVEGMGAVYTIEQSQLNGEAPATRVDVKTVRLIRQ